MRSHSSDPSPMLLVVSGSRHRKGRGTDAPEEVGLRRMKGDQGPCGLCGTTTEPLTRTHVPPQCAGNSNGVQRHYLISTKVNGVHTLSEGKKRFQGGLYVYGLCQGCNGAASRWDAAYKELSQGLTPCWVKENLKIPGDRMDLLSVEIAPSAVVRSLTMGLFGLNHHLRERYPNLAQGLLDGTEGLTFPTDMRLMLALARGRRGRLLGPVHTQHVLGPTATGCITKIQTDAAVYFPPLGWQLAHPDSDFLVHQGWHDVSDWLTIPTTERRNVATLVPSLPVVFEPSHDPEVADNLFHLFSDEITPVVETTGLGY
jgi:hypothetical protein